MFFLSCSFQFAHWLHNDKFITFIYTNTDETLFSANSWWTIGICGFLCDITYSISTWSITFSTNFFPIWYSITIYGCFSLFLFLIAISWLWRCTFILQKYTSVLQTNVHFEWRSNVNVTWIYIKSDNEFYDFETKHWILGGCFVPFYLIELLKWLQY